MTQKTYLDQTLWLRSLIWTRHYNLTSLIWTRHYDLEVLSGPDTMSQKPYLDQTLCLKSLIWTRHYDLEVPDTILRTLIYGLEALSDHYGLEALSGPDTMAQKSYLDQTL